MKTTDSFIYDTDFSLWKTIDCNALPVLGPVVDG